jgi:type II secretory pathway component PulK
MLKTEDTIQQEILTMQAQGVPGFNSAKLDGIQQIKNITAVVVRAYAPNIVPPQTGWIWIDTSTGKAYIAMNTSLITDWAFMGSGSVTSVFGRTAAVTAQSGDYTADQITQTATRVFVTPTMKAYSDISTGIVAPVSTPGAI